MLLAALHVLSLLSIAVLRIDMVVAALLVGAVLASAWQAWRSWASAGVTCLRLGRNAQCEIQKVGAGGTASVQEHSVIFDSLIVLTLAGECGRQTLVLLPDSSDAESLRRLRVWLKASA